MSGQRKTFLSLRYSDVIKVYKYRNSLDNRNKPFKDFFNQYLSFLEQNLVRCFDLSVEFKTPDAILLEVSIQHAVMCVDAVKFLLTPAVATVLMKSWTLAVTL